MDDLEAEMMKKIREYGTMLLRTKHKHGNFTTPYTLEKTMEKFYPGLYHGTGQHAEEVRKRVMQLTRIAQQIREVTGNPRLVIDDILRSGRFENFRDQLKLGNFKENELEPFFMQLQAEAKRGMFGRSLESFLV